MKTEATYFAKAGKLVVINNAGSDETTTVSLTGGRKAKTVRLPAHGIQILSNMTGSGCGVCGSESSEGGGTGAVKSVVGQLAHGIQNLDMRASSRWLRLRFQAEPFHLWAG